MAVHIRIDASDFRHWLKREMLVTKRTLAESINRHAYHINLAANRGTRRAKRSDIRAYLMSDAGGKVKGVPIAALIINSRRGREGQPGLYGQEMRAEVASYIRKKSAHVAFLSAGFLPAIAVYARKLGIGVGANARRWLAKASQVNMGGAIPATNQINPMATFWNDAMGERSSMPQDAMQFKANALQIAIKREVAGMAKYVAKKMQQATNKTASRF